MKLKDIDAPEVQELKDLLESVKRLRDTIRGLLADVESFQPAEFTDTMH